MKTSFSFSWVGNTNLIFRNTSNREVCEVCFFSERPEGTIEYGPILKGTLEGGIEGFQYHTQMRPSEVDKDCMILFLSEMTGLPVEQIEIKPPARLP